MRQAEELNRNPKIGRPAKTEKGIEFKKEYQSSELKFEIQCELLVSIHEQFFIEPPADPLNRRVEIAYATALFEKHNCLAAYEVLLKLNEFYYKNSSIFPEDRLKYTSLIDIAYMFKQLRLNLGDTLRSIELVLAVLFFLYNEKLVNLNFYQYIENKVEPIAVGMLRGRKATQDFDRIQKLIIALILEIAVKQGLKLKK